ncbi:hypothetical protein [Nocardia spumae]|uniref:hypothetical protein n=1 Tax=Nocardia spumae TaxID=2887190 RepID=UPI001D1483C0|nr:hypothetical protein [Nocardia spumae]
MSTAGTLTLIAAATVLCTGGGIATAADITSATPVIAPGEPDPSGTGSASGLAALVDALASGSAQATATAR